MSPILTATAPATLTRRTKLFTLAGVLLALFLGSLDQTIVSTAMPRIVADLHGFDRFTWVATAYLVASTTLVPVYGKLADMYSRRAIEVAAILIFLAGSMLCGLAGEFGPLPLLGDGMSQLIIFRAVQGLGGAGLFAMAFIVIADLFAPAERGRYQGFVGATFGLSSVLGPFLGGLLTDHGTGLVPGIAGWRLVFYVNLPLGLLALWFILSKMPRLKPRGEKQPLDYISALLLMLGLVPLIIALQLNKAHYGWASGTTLGLLALAAAALALFVVRSLRSANPILDLNLFRNHVFRPAIIAVFLLGGSFLSIVIFEPLFMVNVLGVSATKAGVSLIPLSLGVVAGSMLAGRMVSRFGHYKRWMLGGLLLLLTGLLLLATMPMTVSYAQVLGYVLLCGLGLGPTMPLYTLAIQNAIEPRFMGQATAASQFFRQIGGAVAAALLGTMLTVSLAGALPPAGAVAPASRPVVVAEGAAELAGTAPGGLPVSPALRVAFARAISHIYLFTMCLVAAGWVVSLFIPELPLRRSNAEPGAAKQ
ncbi:drug resistance transporter, EmrB/QacA subfamily [Hymenobacter daecheongensis DSM 21074]|uniref:Drug resistance transporter, EmrB/QacA subfamily n=1 Tax=Hymenobacter daecheongensis DSM 21074 TaxID=1121955 RepID=A0A1M6I035_9BACT|nr:MDR family MFS transporter [Hymenobacter daecheongensis]SHJ27750.1 drug resistance transporter, EmrB/QacA subfamily [Hymenobacter daecheongensis DSM 21074]